MTDVLTTAKKLTQPAKGSHISTWGAILNTNFGLIDTALGGTLTKSISGSVTLTPTETQSTGYSFTGTFGATATITFPLYYGLAVISNSTTQAIRCGITGGSFVTIPVGYVGALWSDGTNFNFLSNLPLEGASVASTATGGAATLPTHPIGFVTVNIQGTDRMIPFYDP